MEIINELHKILVDLDISTIESIEDFPGSVRDAEGIKVKRCTKSGVFFLDKIHNPNVYEKNNEFDYWNTDLNKHKRALKGVPQIFLDDFRRKNQFFEVLQGKDWLDIGCGSGGLLRLMKDFGENFCGVELQKGPREFLKNEGFKVFESLSEAENDSFDIVTLFHVFEHISDPLNFLKEVKRVLRPGGRVIVEVPHANDVLLNLYESEGFRNFTFRYEHLILHTRDSLKKFLNNTGFEVKVIEGFQRYSISNHMHWLSQDKPGGHLKWSFLDNDLMKEAYAKTLEKIDATDTIIAFADLK